MSDSESDLLSNNVFTFQNQGTTVCAKGPNINNANISSLSFRSNMMSSNMPWNLDRPRYAESAYDQRSVSYRRREREWSPMSYHSVSGMQPRNFHHSYYPGGMSSHRSMYNGRSGSPGSVRTIDSNASLSARDIASAFKAGNFNKFELQIIKDAYVKFLKGRVRKRAERRRIIRRRSGGYSGDQASDSSISSDDRRTTRTSKSTMYKENMSSCRSTKTDFSDFRRTMIESNLFRDRTDNLKQNSLRKMFEASSRSVREQFQNTSVASQKDRFKTGFLLPSQRFNQSVASSSIPEIPGRHDFNKNRYLNVTNTTTSTQNKMPDQKRSHETDSEQEDIFTDVTAMERSSFNSNGKRVLYDENVPVSDKKRSKPSSPQKQGAKPKTPKQSHNVSITKQKPHDFIFAKPQCPIRKSIIVKQQKVSKTSQLKDKPTTKTTQSQEKKVSKTVQPGSLESITKSLEQPGEKLISSSQKSVQNLVSKPPQEKLISKPINEQQIQNTKSPKAPQEKEQVLLPEDTQLSTTNMSMRPSFIKRKLFTQKVDVAEKNSSSDSLQIDSPQTNIYSKIQKEKNKARKLVTTQSCLNRDVLGDDSNLLDLIHKIVPPDQMNVTTATNKSEIQNNRNKLANADKLDVTSIISTCNNSGNVSDTFTDEEIFNADESTQLQKKVNQQPDDKQQKCRNNQQKNGEMQKQIHMKQKEAHTDDKHIANKQQKTQISLSPYPKCRVVLERPQPKVVAEINDASVGNEHTSPTEINGLIKRNMFHCVKSFWDTDVESDFEATPVKEAVIMEKGISMVKAVSKVTSDTVNGQSNHDFSKPSSKNKKPNTTLTTNTITEKAKKQSNEDKKISTSKAENKPLEAPKIQKKSDDDNSKINTNAEKAKKQYNENKKISTSKAGNESLEARKIQKNADDNRKLTINTHAEKAKKQSNKNTKVSTSNKHSEKLKDNKSNTSLKIKNKDSASQTRNINPAPKKNINTTLKIKESVLPQVRDTVKIRSQRTPKVHKCCGESGRSEKSINSNCDTLCRSLRSRQVDLSTSIESGVGNILTKQTAAKNKRLLAKSKTNMKQNENTLPSDISFTLTEISVLGKQTTKMKNTNSKAKDRKTRQSDVSFTLVSDKKTLDNTVSTRGTSKRNRELESLLNSTLTFFKSTRRSPLNRKITPESIALNRTRNTSKLRS